MKQRLLSLLLALALLLSLLPAAAQTVRAEELEERPAAADQAETKAQKAEARREHSREELTRGMEDAAELRLDEPYEVVITEPDEHIWLRFTPQETGPYVLSAAAEFADNYCTLYDSEYNVLSSDDDGGKDLNFRLFHQLEAGACYYYEIFYLDDEQTGSFPVTLTVYDPVRSGACGDELSWSFDLDTGVLTIEGQGDMWSFWPQRGDGYVSSDAVPWNEFLDQITELRLPEGLSSIGDVAFQGCLALDSVTIPGTVRRIGQFAFSGCGALQSIVIPEGVTTIGARAFDYCESLTEVELAASVSSVEELAFRECYNLETIRFLNPACDIADDCLADARSVIVCGFPDSTAETYAEEHGLLFLPFGATELTGVCGDNLTWRFAFDTGVLSIEGQGDMWSFWPQRGDGYVSSDAVPWGAVRRKITELRLPEGLSSIGDVAFQDCSALESVTIPGTVRRIGQFAFCGCTALQSIVIPEGVTTIGARAFDYCESLTEVELAASVSSVEELAFRECYNLEMISFLNPACDIAYDCLEGSGSGIICGFPDSTAETYAEEHGLLFLPFGATELTGVCGDELTWHFDFDTGVLSIEGQGDMWSFWPQRGDGYVSSDAVPWGAVRRKITELRLPEGLSSIGDVAFQDCSGLESVTIPGTVRRIGQFAFCSCTALQSIVIPEGVTTIGARAFDYCESLTEVELAASVSSVEELAFRECYNLEMISFLNPACDIAYDCLEGSGSWIIRGFPDSTAERFAEEAGLLFLPFGATELSGVCGDNLTWRFDFNTGLLTIEGDGELIIPFDSDAPSWHSFRTRITAVDLPEGLTYIGADSFSGCTGLTELHLPDSTTQIDLRAFADCSGLTELIVPENVVNVSDYAFAYCTNLRSITFLNQHCEIMSDILIGCEDVTVRGWNYSTAREYAERNGLPFESIGDKECSGSCGDNLTWRFEPEGGVLRIEGSGAMYDYYDGGLVTMPSMPWYFLSKSIREISLPEGLSEIGEYAFYGCCNVTKLNFPASLRSIGDSAFLGCESLTELNIPDGSVESIGRSAFYCCSGLKKVKLPEGLKEIGGFAFFQCTSLEEIRLPDSLETLSVCAFNRCAGLREVTLSGQLRALDEQVFSECEALDTVFLAAGFRLEDNAICFRALFSRPADYYYEEPEYTSVPQSFVVDPENPFFSADADGVLYDKDQTVLLACPPTASGSFTVPEGVVEIDRAAFAYCGDLREIHFPESLRRIGASAFCFCDGLTELRFPERLERIGDCAFLHCDGLRSVKLPGVGEIGGDAFRGCLALREFVCRDPDCLATAWHCTTYTEALGETEEDLSVYENNYEFSESVGQPGYTLIFGRHDAEKENAEQVERNYTGDSENHSVDLCRWLENYAGEYGYTFCDLGAFSDVTENSYYELPVAWAVAMGVTSGAGEGVFAPKKTCTREQIVTFLWKALGAPEPEASESPFSDVKPGKYYFKPVLWAVENGVTGGVGDGKFGVGRPCTREQAMSFLWKALGSPEPEGTESTFTDVKPGKYYYKPVLWAVENGVTGGVGDGKFGVGSTCTRAQIVTFLYKAFQ